VDPTSNTCRADSVIVVVGAPGDAKYGKLFRAWADRWITAAKKNNNQVTTIGLKKEENADRDLLQKQLSSLKGESQESLWIVLIGHGTYDRETAKFNLRGPDVTAAQLGEWLQPIERPVAIVNCTSASSPFLNKLTGPGRIVVTATNSGFQYNFARFGEFISAAIATLEADLDKDKQVSLLEAFLFASAKTQEFYRDNARLATERALLDDNGDGLGTPADWFRGVRAVKRAKKGGEVDGRVANQWHLIRSALEAKLTAEARAARDKLEQELETLREKKKDMHEDEYYVRLERILIQLSRLYDKVGKEER